MPVLLVALAVSPVIIGGLSRIGDTWLPVGDWASMLFRTGQVGTGDTPLIGTYSVKGWAHPGPVIYYAAAPLDRLTSGDPRSLEWTAAILNAVTISAIGAVAWRRGRYPLTVAVLIFVGLLIHGLGPATLVNLWNPFLGLLPFLLAVLLAWDAALGRPEAVVVAAVPATVAIQCHVSFGPLLAVVAVWLVCWTRWRRLVPDDEPVAGAGMDAARTGPLRHQLGRAGTLALVVAAVLWLPPLVDLVFDTHNLVLAAGHLAAGAGEQIGLVEGLSLVSRHVRPDGPWMGGAEPSNFRNALGSGPVVVFVVLAVLAGCVHVARRRRLADVAALATLTIALVVAAIPAAGNLVEPVFLYLTQWLKVIGMLVWFTVGWTIWRVAEPSVRAVAGRGVVGRGVVARRGVGVAACAGLVATVAWSWGDATTIEPGAVRERAAVQDLRAQVDAELPRDVTYRIDGVADLVGHNAPGMIYYMIEDGYDVLTGDGAAGLKWGHAHRYDRGDHYDVRLTVAVHYGGSWRDAYLECLRDPRVELVASYDALDPDQRARLDDLKMRKLTEPESLADAEVAEADRLEADGFRVGVFEGDRGCARRDPTRRSRD